MDSRLGCILSRDVEAPSGIREISPERCNLSQRPSTTRKPVYTHEPTSNHHNGIRVESRRSHVRQQRFLVPGRPQLTILDSYNRYIAVASRVVRRSLKEDKRIIAERRGESELRFAKWEVSDAGWRDEGIYGDESRTRANEWTEWQAG
jgi:hypothetical protein